MQSTEIIKKLPYTEPFLFVDQILSISENGVVGTYAFKKDADFYRGHFKDYPITPGVLITECMAQIGLVCLAIFLSEKEEHVAQSYALSHTDIDFLLPVYPGEKVKVVSEKIYFRFGKLKCKVKMVNTDEKLVAHGEISGMTIKKNE